MDTEAELERLSAAFFAAVSFEDGSRPDYDAIRDLFISAGITRSGCGSTSVSVKRRTS